MIQCMKLLVGYNHLTFFIDGWASRLEFLFQLMAGQPTSPSTYPPKKRLH